METYRIENLNLFMSIKDLEQPKILTIEIYQQHSILVEGFQWHKSSGNDGRSCSIAIVSPSPKMSTKDHTINIMGKTFSSSFVHKYMIENCKYKGGGLGKLK